MSSQPTIILTDPTDELIATLAKFQAERVLVLPSLYDLPAEGEIVAMLQAIEGDLIVVERSYPRATFWLLASIGVEGQQGDGKISSGETGRRIICFDQRELQGDALADAIAQAGFAATADPSTTPVERLDEKIAPRWYPIIDQSRCVDCFECLNFCLFGVYGTDVEGHLFTEQADACRNGCPACARVCPRGAIMFPRHGEASIAGGESVATEDTARAKSEKQNFLDGGTLPLLDATKQAKDDIDELVDRMDEMDL